MDYIDEDSTFAEEVEFDSGICSSCYRRIREKHEPPEYVPDVQGNLIEYEEDVDFAYVDDYEFSGRVSVHRAYCPCGPIDWKDVKIRPLDQESMVKCGERISARLEEKDIKHDISILLEYIEKEADKPENQFREEKVFQEAVYHST